MRGWLKLDVFQHRKKEVIWAGQIGGANSEAIASPWEQAFYGFSIFCMTSFSLLVHTSASRLYCYLIAAVHPWSTVINLFQRGCGRNTLIKFLANVKTVLQTEAILTTILNPHISKYKQIWEKVQRWATILISPMRGFIYNHRLHLTSTGWTL